MRVDVDTKSTKWRRFIQDNAGSDMNVVTAMALSPDHSQIACHGSVFGSPNWSIHSWFWVVRTNDGGFGGDMRRVTHGSVGTSEHITTDQSLIWP